MIVPEAMGAVIACLTSIAALVPRDFLTYRVVTWGTAMSAPVMLAVATVAISVDAMHVTVVGAVRRVCSSSNSLCR